MHEAGLAQPGTMAAVLGLDDEQVEVACRRADDDVWVANYNAPGQVVIAGSPEGVERASGHAKDLGAKKVMPLQVVGRLPHAVHDRRPATGCAARSPRPTPATPRCPSSRNVDALPHHEGKEWASLLSAQLSSRCAGSTACSSWRTSASPTTPSSAPAACSPAWRSGRRPGRTISVATPEDLDKLIEWVGADGADRTGTRSRASTSSPSSGSSSARPPASSREPAASTTGTSSRSAPCSGHVGAHEVRSPFAGVLQSYIAVETERLTARQPIAWLRTQLRRRTPPCRRSDPGVRGAVITGWGTALPPKTLTNHDLQEMGLDTSDEWIVERTGIRERRVGGTTAGLSAEAGRQALGMSGLDPSEHRRHRAGHHHARPHGARHVGRPSPPSSACAAAPSTSTPPARASPTRWSSPTA